MKTKAQFDYFAAFTNLEDVRKQIIAFGNILLSIEEGIGYDEVKKIVADMGYDNVRTVVNAMLFTMQSKIESCIEQLKDKEASE